jgi:hypothetical protein
LAGKKESPMSTYPSHSAEPVYFAASRGRMNEILTRLSSPAMMCATGTDLEEYVKGAGAELMRQMIQDQLDARAALEVREAEVRGADGVVRRRAEPGALRQLATTVGTVQVARIAYRAPGAGNLHPADAVLALPARLYSHPLCKAVVYETTSASLRRAGDGIERACGRRIGTRQLMEITERAARDVRDYYRPGRRARGAAAPGVKPVLVLSIDATGVNVIPSALREGTAAAVREPGAPSAQLASRERTGRCRMANVTALYDAHPAVRSAADVMPRDAAERAGRRPGPKTGDRLLNASLEHPTKTMVTALFDQAETRDPGHERRWLALVDGNNHQLECLENQAAARGIDLHILIDFVHVLEYVWKAAEDVHPTTPTRHAFVQETVRRILEGQAPSVVADLETLHRAKKRDSADVPGLERAIAYLTAKRPYLNYHIALAPGWPIATGVIEGSCRFLVKDRLDITGARWSVQAGEAVLLLRALIANGDFEDYWRFHIEREYQREHASLKFRTS